jgi:Reverse transcriptase (RNA-dependent DNA polymerase)
MYMAIPRGCELPPEYNSKDYCLKLKKNIYGQKQAGRVWLKHLESGLSDIGFEPSKVLDCLYYRGSTVLLVYVDDMIVFDPSDAAIDQVYQDLKKANFDVTDEGDISDYLGVTFEHKQDGTIHLTQRKLIQQVLKDIKFRENTNPVDYPAKVSELLTASLDSEPHKADWSYPSIVGKLHYLEACSRPDLSYSVHQAARFSANPRKPHADAVT